MTPPADRPAPRDVRGHLNAWRQALRDVHAHRALVMAALPKLREARGLGLREAARLADLSAATLSQSEHGGLDLSLDAAERLFGVLTTEDA